MKCLITGGAGFIGGHLYQKLTERGHEVIALDNFFHPTNNPINQEVRNLDIRSGAVAEFVEWADIVYHLAAQIHVDFSNLHPVETFDINVNGLLNILELCKKYEKKLVFASSSEIYGTSQDKYMFETHPLNPQSPYAVTKLAGDKLCSVYKETYGMRINIIRNFNTFGPWQNDTSYGGVIAKFTKAALKGEPLTVYGDGKQERDYMYIDDALEGYLGSLTMDWAQPVNFGTGKTVSVNEIAELIIKLTESKSEIVHTDPRPGEVQRLCAGIQTANLLGFKPKTDFERDLGTYINWYKNANFNHGK